MKKNNKQALRTLTENKGVIAVLAAIMIMMFMGFAALAVDIGYGMVTKNELQNIADAAALAAARRLGVIYQGMSYDEQIKYVVNSTDAATIKNAAILVASKNKAGGDAITLNEDDIIIGTWDPSTAPDHLTVTMDQPDAVRVIARRDNIANLPITTFFAKIFGTQTRNVRAQATASLTGQSTSGPGELELPVGISRWWFDNNACNDSIQFNPSNSPDSCAGWTSWEYGSNDVNLRRILDENPQYPSPGTLANDSVFNFIGGQLSNPTFDALLSLFQKKGYDVDRNGNPILGADGKPLSDATGTGQEVTLCQKDVATDCAVPCDATYTTRLYYPDGTARNKHEWPTTVVVYDRGDCSNPNQSILILGFATVNVNNVCNAPYKLIRGIVECKYTTPEDNRGGGGPYGNRGPIPGLVE